MVGTNPRVRGLARWMGFILCLSALGAILLVLRSWASGPRAEGKKATGIRAANSKVSGQARLDLDGRGTAKDDRWKGVFAQLPLSFEANEGQSGPQVKFLSRGAGYALFLTGREAVLALKSQQAKANRQEPTGKSQGQRTNDAVLRMSLVGANPNAEVSGLDELPGKANYFLGNDPAKWRTNVPTYAKVKYRDVYPGVDLVYYGNQRQLEYDFVVAPGADPSAIRLAFVSTEGSKRKAVGSGNGNSKFEIRNAKLEKRNSRRTLNSPLSTPYSLQLAANGDLLISTNGGEMRFQKPVVYQPATDNRQPRTEVEGHYRLTGHQVKFEVAKYDPTRPLVIDPALALTYSSYLGGSGNDLAYGIAIDSSGNAYLAGQTYSSNFPTKNPLPSADGSCASCASGLSNAFVAKINSSGSALEYSTFLGGSGGDSASAIAVDSAGDAYVTGGTGSTDFPTTGGVIQTTGNIFGDAFITELNPAGSALVFSTFLGGTTANAGAVPSTDGNAIGLDGSENVYVAGSTSANDFPVANSYQQTLKGTANVFVSEIQSQGTKLAYSTYLGGAGQDTAYAIAVGAPNVYVAGETTSNNFPTASAYQASYGGQGDAFVARLVFSGANITLGYSTYLGGTSLDQAYGLAVDSSGDAYVTGDTQSTNFPTQNAFQTKLAGGSTQAAFVAELNTCGGSAPCPSSTLVYSTYLGGGSSNADTGYAVAVDSTGVAHVVGSTNSPTFPTLNPIQSANNGKTNVFLTRLNPQGCGLEFSTYLGGSTTDVARAVATDSSGDSFLTGYTGSNNFPTQSPFQSATGGNNDVFVAEVPAVSGGVPSVCFSPSALTFSAQASTTTSAAMNATLTNEGSAALSITSIAATGPFAETNTCGSSLAAAANCTISVTFSPTQAGQLSGSVTVTDNAGGTSSATQTVGLQGVGTDFALAMTPATASASAGQSQTFMLTLTPSQDFTDEVTLSCNTSPAIPAGSCTISPTSITPTTTSNYTATVTVTTTAKSFTPPGFGNRQPPLTWLVVLLAAGLLAAGAWARRRDARLPFRFVAIAGIALLVFAWFGCGVSNGPATYTPAGNYTIAITGVDGSLNHVIHSVLTVN